MARYRVYNRRGELAVEGSLTLAQAGRRHREHGDVVTLKLAKPPKRRWRVLVQRENGRGWRVGRFNGRKKLTSGEAERAVLRYNRRNRVAKTQLIPDPRTLQDALVHEYLSGDLDFDRPLQLALARAARDLKVKLHVNYGKRTRAEQAALYEKYGPGRAAAPGTSRHETGKAADVVRRGMPFVNIGDIPGAKLIMQRHGLCLPVAGEKWHVEQGSVWRA